MTSLAASLVCVRTGRVSHSVSVGARERTVCHKAPQVIDQIKCVKVILEVQTPQSVVQSHLEQLQPHGSYFSAQNVYFDADCMSRSGKVERGNFQSCECQFHALNRNCIPVLRSSRPVHVVSGFLARA